MENTIAMICFLLSPPLSQLETEFKETEREVVEIEDLVVILSHSEFL